MRGLCVAAHEIREAWRSPGLSYEKAAVSQASPFDRLVTLEQPARTIETINYVRRSLGKAPFEFEGYTPPEGFLPPDLAGEDRRRAEPASGSDTGSAVATLPNPDSLPSPVLGGLPIGGPTDRPITVVRSQTRPRPPRIDVLHGELIEQTRALISACGQNNAAAGLRARLVRLESLLGDTPDDMLAHVELVWFRIDEVRALHATEVAERAKADRLSQELPAALFAAAETFVRASNVIARRVPALAELDEAAPGPDRRRTHSDVAQAAAVAKVLADAPDVVSPELAETLVEAVKHAGVDPNDVALPPEAPRPDEPHAGQRAQEFAGRSVVNTVLELVRRAAAAVRDAAMSGTATVAGWGRKAASVAVDYMVGRVTSAAKLGGTLILLGGFVGTVVKFQVVLNDVAMRWLPAPAYQMFKFTLDNIITILGKIF
jgi:hypothetical protein